MTTVHAVPVPRRPRPPSRPRQPVLLPPTCSAFRRAAVGRLCARRRGRSRGHASAARNGGRCRRPGRAAGELTGCPAINSLRDHPVDGPEEGGAGDGNTVQAAEVGAAGKEQPRLLGGVAYQDLDAGRRAVPGGLDPGFLRQGRVTVLGAERHRSQHPELPRHLRHVVLPFHHFHGGSLLGDGLGGDAHGVVHPGPPARNAQGGALDNGALEQCRGFGRRHQVGDRVTACGLAEGRDPAGIAAECGDVALHPAEGFELVQQAQVGRPARAGCQEAEQPQPVGHRDHHHAVLGYQYRRVEDGEVARSGGVGTAVDPHHHGQPRAFRAEQVHVRGHGDGQVLAVLAPRQFAVAGAQDVVQERHGPLRAGGSRGGCGIRPGPVGGRSRRLETSGGGVRDPGGAEDVAVPPACDGTAGGTKQGLGTHRATIPQIPGSFCPDMQALKALKPAYLDKSSGMTTAGGAVPEEPRHPPSGVSWRPHRETVTVGGPTPAGFPDRAKRGKGDGGD